MRTTAREPARHFGSYGREFPSSRAGQAVSPVTFRRCGQAEAPVLPWRRGKWFAVLLAFSLAAQTDTQPWFATVAKLAAALSGNDSIGAMETIDRNAKDYATIESDIEALVSQTDILCAIDPVEDRESGGIHDVDADWYMQLKSQTQGGPVERRRERVHIQLRQINGKWRIVSLAPIEILAPIHI